MIMFEHLLSSGLPITWNVVIMAYSHQFEIPSMVSALITTEQVLEFAMDRIGYDPPELERWTIELAYAHDRDTWTINRCLEALVSEEPDAKTYALRVWRWVLMGQAVAALDEFAQMTSDVGTLDYGKWYGVYYDLRDVWRCIAVPNDCPQLCKRMLSPGMQVDALNALSLLEEHHRWLNEEEKALRSLSS